MDSVSLAVEGASAVIAARGAEPLSWRVDGRELLWSGDPEHWEFRAPILFPRVGASQGGRIEVDGVSYPMAQHGFARRSPFELVERTDASARFRLADTATTREHYPFAFRLDVTVELRPAELSLAFEVANTGERAMPYALGFHPAFPWPFAANDKTGHRVVFEAEESAEVPEVSPGGLLARTSRRVPMNGRELPLSPELFSEALVFLDASSRAFWFAGPTGAIELKTDGFPHLAVWSRPDAPFLSLECWTGHADWEDTAGELAARPSMISLAPGAVGRHAVALVWHAT